MKLAAAGKNVHVVTDDGEPLNALAFSGDNAAASSIVMAGDGNKIQYQNTALYQYVAGVGFNICPLKVDGEKRTEWYLLDGMTFQLGFANIESVDENGARYFRIARADLPPQVEEG